MRRSINRYLLLTLAVLALLQTGPAQTPPSGTAANAEFAVEDAAITATSAGDLLWSLDFAANSGPDSGLSTVLLDTADALYAGHGNSVLRIDPATGRVLWRTAVSGAVTRIDAAAAGISVVTALQDGLSERIQLTADGQATATVRFGTDPQVFSWLRAEAQVPDVTARLQQDPTNPWLYLGAAQVSSEPARQELFSQAVQQAGTFYDLAGLARVLVLEREFELAGQAMQQSLADFEKRDYSPALLTDLTLHEAYGFPLQPLLAAERQGDGEASAFWARWLRPFATDQVPAIQQALAAFPADSGTAADPPATAGSPAALTDEARAVDRFFITVSHSGWLLFAAVVVAILALQVTLTLKYWAPQSLVLRRSRETGGRGSFAARFLAIRFFSTTEKLVLVLLYAAGLLLLGLVSWNQQTAAVPVALQSGTLASAEAVDALDRLTLRGPAGELIRDYAVRTSGDAAAAQLPDAGQLSMPTRLDWHLALTGTWQQAVSRVFMNPWSTLAPLAFFGWPHWAWLVLLGLYLLLGTVTLLWLLVPRPRLARNAPRIMPYQVLALLIPGAGLADEAWGVLLLLPWALFSMDLLQQQLGRPSPLGVSELTGGIVLAVLYAVNLGAFLVELGSYRRRMKILLQAHPETAQAYGLS